MTYQISREFIQKVLREKYNEQEDKFLERERRGQFTNAQRDAILEEAIKVSFMAFQLFF